MQLTELPGVTNAEAGDTVRIPLRTEGGQVFGQAVGTVAYFSEAPDEVPHDYLAYITGIEGYRVPHEDPALARAGKSQKRTDAWFPPTSLVKAEKTESGASEGGPTVTSSLTESYAKDFRN